MKKRYLTAFYLVLAIVMGISVSASACTQVYVGSEASADGSIILARSNDYQRIWPNYIEVVERIENQPGRELPIDEQGNVSVPVKDTTFKYQTTPWMDYTVASNGMTRDGTCGTNEKGVIMTMAVTAFSSETALAADPLVEGGLSEQAACDIVLSQAATAREGIEILADIIDSCGNGQVNIALIADRTEAWYMEMYTGHQYAAVKLPQDSVAVFGNEFTMEFLSDYEDAITSTGLELIPEDFGFAVTDDEKGLNLYETYSGSGMVRRYSRLRTWIGHSILSPLQYGEYDESVLYPLVFVPDDKVSLQDAMEIMRNRYEGTEYSPDETGRTDMRVIGTDTAMSVHVLQVYPSLPEDISAVLWECTGPAVYGVFVPVSNASYSVAESYGRNQSGDEKDSYNFPADVYPWYAIKEINTIGMQNPTAYGKPAREVFGQIESEMYCGMKAALEDAVEIYEESPEKAKELLTGYCVRVQSQAFEDELSILNKLRWYESFCSNTLKLAKNPETGEYSGELKVYAPVELTVNLDNYKYLH